MEPRRRRAPSMPRNAEELADHLIHGSLRMTASRQQILSYSGIKLEERATALQQQDPQEREEHEQTTGDKIPIENDVFESAVELSSEEEHDINDDGQDSSDYEPSKSVSRKLSKSTRQIEPSSLIKSTNSVSDSEAFVTRTRSSSKQNGSQSWNSIDHHEHSPYNTRRMRRNSSGAYATSTSEMDGETTVNGFNSTHPTIKPVDHIISRVLRTRGRSNSSSQYETGGYSSEDKISDRPRLFSIPSASSFDDLTTIAKKKKVNRKRKNTFRGGIEKKLRLTSESSDAGSVGLPVNGVTVNGAQCDIKHLDVVWAKCRGYPSYPALVSHTQTLHHTCNHIYSVPS